MNGAEIARYNAVQPDRLDETAIKWDGEWQITIEVFRDLGLAFAVVLVLIYVLVVGWFQSFTIPLVIMAPIPLTLIGILPGHALTGRVLHRDVDDRHDRAGRASSCATRSCWWTSSSSPRRAGGSLREAVIEAGAVRFRPIALTAAAVVVGGLVMVLDPIFQGLAVALMSGAVVATLLTMVVVPLLYWELRRRRQALAPTDRIAGDGRTMGSEVMLDRTGGSPARSFCASLALGHWVNPPGSCSRPSSGSTCSSRRSPASARWSTRWCGSVCSGAACQPRRRVRDRGVLMNPAGDTSWFA